MRAGRSAATGACEQSLVSFIPFAIRVVSRFARTYVRTGSCTQRNSSVPTAVEGRSGLDWAVGQFWNKRQAK